MNTNRKLNVRRVVPVLTVLVIVGAALAAASMLMPQRPASAMGETDAGDGHRVDAVDEGRGTEEANATQTSRQPLTRAELAQLLADAFALEPSNVVAFSDVRGHEAEDAVAAVTAAGIMDGWFDGTFRPHQPVTRAELTTAVVRALGLAETADAHPYPEPVFRDVTVHHQAYAAVSMAHRLGLYPFHVGSFFAPDEPVEAAEARHMIRTAAGLERLAGPIAHVNAPARTVAVQEDARRTIAYTVGESTLIVRNGAAVEADTLRSGDHVQVYADASGRLLVAVATGPEAEPTVVSEATRLLRELATPEQLSAIISRDWERAGAELKVSLYNQLVEAGASHEEATALLEQDWATVEERAKERLVALVTEQAELEPELVRALLEQDWTTAQTYVEAEVLEYVLNYLMQTDPAQQAVS